MTDYHLSVAALIIAAGILLHAALIEHHIATRGRTGHTWQIHLRRHGHHHALAALLWLCGVVIAVAGIGYVVLHHGGFTPPPGFHKVPPVHRIAAGGRGTLTTGDMSALVTLDVQDQVDTLACCGVTIERLDAMNRARRGERVPVPLSGYKPWHFVTGGQNVGTTPDDEAAQWNQHGAELLRGWGPHGVPDAGDDALTTRIGGTRVSWDFYVDTGGGQAGLDDIIWRLEHNTPVGIVWAVHADGDTARGVAYTWDGGAFAYEHCLTAVQYTSNYPGIGAAVRVWNSYGLGYGLGGYVWLPAAVVKSHVQGAFVETPGPPVRAWLPPPPPPPTPTVTPCTPTPLTMTHAVNAHTLPRLGTPAAFGLAQGARITALCLQNGTGATAHWALIADVLGRQGWIIRTFAR